jgi:uncharacterized protein (TIGR03435 family)
MKSADSAVAALSLRVRVRLIAVAVCLIPALRAYAADSGAPTFEVASVKLSVTANPIRDRLLQMMADEKYGAFVFLPGRGQRIEIRGMSAAELVAAAHRIPLREILGPSWMSDARFDIDALVPSGQTRDKAPEMLLTLLQDRLALKAHREVRKTSGYILSVAEGGPKLKEAPPLKPTNDVGHLSDRSRTGYHGLSEQLGHCDMAQLANSLAHDLQAPVEDGTGLKGFYSILIQIPDTEWKDQDQRPAAFREAIGAYGLRLAAGKIDAPILVIDNLSKTPIPN